jgi:hypothetical protein
LAWPENKHRPSTIISAIRLSRLPPITELIPGAEVLMLFLARLAKVIVLSGNGAS